MWLLFKSKTKIRHLGFVRGALYTKGHGLMARGELNLVIIPCAQYADINLNPNPNPIARPKPSPLD